MRYLIAVLAALLTAAPADAQDTTAVLSDRQLRQQAGYAVTDARTAIIQLTELLARAERIHRAADARVARDSLLTVPTPKPEPQAPAPVPAKPLPPTPDTAASHPPPVPPSATAGLLFADGFDSGERAPSTHGAGWRRSGSGSVVAGAGRGGGHALEFSWPATPAAGSGNNPPLREERFSIPALPEVWLEWWVLLPSNWEHRRTFHLGGPDNNKFTALWRDVYSEPAGVQVIVEAAVTSEVHGQTSLARSVYQGAVFPPTADRSAGRFRHAPLYVPEQIGVWTRYRVHARLSSAPGVGDGRFVLWRGDEVVVDTGPFIWQPREGEAYFSNGYLYGAQNSGYDEPTTLYVDDFRIYGSDPGWR